MMRCHNDAFSACCRNIDKARLFELAKNHLKIRFVGTGSMQEACLSSLLDPKLGPIDEVSMLYVFLRNIINNKNKIDSCVVYIQMKCV